jgi:hypothetical protein
VLVGLVLPLELNHCDADFEIEVPIGAAFRAGELEIWPSEELRADSTPRRPREFFTKSFIYFDMSE